MIIPTNSLSVEALLTVKDIQTIKPTPMEGERTERRDRLTEGGRWALTIKQLKG